MTSAGTRWVGAMGLVACLVVNASAVRAQGVEVMPFGGYRFGGDFFEILTTRPVDVDVAAALGIVFDIPLSNGVQVEAMVTRETARVSTGALAPSPTTSLRATIDHWQVGGLQAFDTGRVQPFATGTLGLTRYAIEGDSEIRFSLGAGGGVKLFPWPRLGARLEGRAFVTLVDADAHAVACAPGVCVAAIHADLVWQAEFTAGVVVRFP